MKSNTECDFCKEFQSDGSSLFEKLYSNELRSRIVLEDDSFTLIPTMGQLFENSFLIIPKNHVETISRLSKEEFKKLELFFERAKSKLSKFGYVVAFEHGAQSDTGGSCGIYHAHIHIMPLPSKINILNFFKDKYETTESLIYALESLKNSKEYLIAISDNNIGFLDLTTLPKKYPSQFFRKEISEHYNLDVSWNWKDYKFVESKLLNSVINFQ